MEAISANDAPKLKVQIQVARYSHMAPARPPLMSEKVLVRSIATHVDMVVVASPNTDRDLKFLRSS